MAKELDFEQIKSAAEAYGKGHDRVPARHDLPPERVLRGG